MLRLTQTPFFAVRGNSMFVRTMPAAVFCLMVFMFPFYSAAQEQRNTSMTPQAPHLVSPHAVITRDKSTKQAFLEVKTTGPWALFAGKTIDTIDYGRSILRGEGPGVFPVPGEEKAHSLFALRRGDSTLVLAERLLPMAGGFNFRDLGGIRTEDGRCVAWGVFFRADDLGGLTPEDEHYLTTLPLRTVVDFRTPEEAARAPDKIPSSVKCVLAYPVALARIDPRTIEKQLEGSNPDAFMKDIYRQLVLNDEARAVYTSLFALLQRGNTLPILFHCSAGKDRTGLASALILLSLGVDRETVMEDYLASARHLEDKYADLRNKIPRFAPFLTVKPEFLESAFAAMEERYGSVDNYLTQALGVNIEVMRRNYLYPCSLP